MQECIAIFVNMRYIVEIMRLFRLQFLFIQHVYFYIRGDRRNKTELNAEQATHD